MYSNIKDLLIDKEPDLVKSYMLAEEKGLLPDLKGYIDKTFEQIIIPQWVIGTSIYHESRIMKSIQYVWENNVIRIWNENVLQDSNILSKNNKIEKKI